jgi:hypothetical protein
LESRVVVLHNLDIEGHANKVYTRAMCEQFGHILYKGFAYRVEEIEKGRIYKAWHTIASRHEKWSRVNLR